MCGERLPFLGGSSGLGILGAAHPEKNKGIDRRRRERKNFPWDELFGGIVIMAVGPLDAHGFLIHHGSFSCVLRSSFLQFVNFLPDVIIVRKQFQHLAVYFESITDSAGLGICITQVLRYGCIVW